MFWLFLLLILLILAAFALTWAFSMAFVRDSRFSALDDDSSMSHMLDPFVEQIEEGKQFLRTAEHTRVHASSHDGLQLAASYYSCGSDCTLIAFHGYRSSAIRDFSCAVKMYLDMGVNVLLVDQRSHGDSEGRLITFGVKERFDVLTWVNFVLEHYGSDTSIFLDGLSMGSSTVMMSAALPLPSNVKGLIADCGYTTPAEIIGRVAEKNFHIKGALAARVLSMLCRLIGGFSLYEASAPKALASSLLPILLVHGKADDFVPPEMSITNYEAAKGPKQLCLVENAGHGCGFLYDRTGIEQALLTFINTYR